MGQPCSICTHPAAENIDSALIRRVSYRELAGRYKVSDSALSRHLNDHLADYVQTALKEKAERKGVKILDKLTSTLSRLDAFLDRAEADGETKEFVMVAAELRKELELLAKLQGDLAQEGTVNINLSPEWIEVRTNIVLALERHPEARESVRAAIEGVGNGQHGS